MVGCWTESQTADDLQLLPVLLPMENAATNHAYDR